MNQSYVCNGSYLHKGHSREKNCISLFYPEQIPQNQRNGTRRRSAKRLLIGLLSAALKALQKYQEPRIRQFSSFMSQYATSSFIETVWLSFMSTSRLILLDLVTNDLLNAV